MTKFISVLNSDDSLTSHLYMNNLEFPRDEYLDNVEYMYYNAEDFAWKWINKRLVELSIKVTYVDICDGYSLTVEGSI